MKIIVSLSAGDSYRKHEIERKARPKLLEKISVKVRVDTTEDNGLRKQIRDDAEDFKVKVKFLNYDYAEFSGPRVLVRKAIRGYYGSARDAKIAHPELYE